MDPTDARFPDLAPDLTLEPRLCLPLSPVGQRFELSRYVSVHKLVDELCVHCEALWMKCGFVKPALHAKGFIAGAAVDGDFVRARHDEINTRTSVRDQLANSK
jgi:hypothetical protein